LWFCLGLLLLAWPAMAQEGDGDPEEAEEDGDESASSGVQSSTWVRVGPGGEELKLTISDAPEGEEEAEAAAESGSVPDTDADRGSAPAAKLSEPGGGAAETESESGSEAQAEAAAEEEAESLAEMVAEAEAESEPDGSGLRGDLEGAGRLEGDQEQRPSDELGEPDGRDGVGPDASDAGMEPGLSRPRDVEGGLESESESESEAESESESESESETESETETETEAVAEDDPPTTDDAPVSSFAVPPTGTRLLGDDAPSSGAAAGVPPVFTPPADEVVWRVKVPPRYPIKARRLGVSGEVVLVVTIDERGVPGNIRLLEGPDMFVQAAVNAVEQWRAEPITGSDGWPIPFRQTIRLRFTLR